MIMNEDKKSNSVLTLDTDNLRFPVPPESRFDDETGDFLVAPELRKIAEELIGDHAFDFDFLRHAVIVYLWKKKGGKSGLKETLGKCQKPSGLLKHFANADFVVWVAADNCEGFTRKQITALLFHELKHAWRDEDGKYVTVSHDFEGFAREVELFGDWKRDIARMREAFRQGDLFAKEVAA